MLSAVIELPEQRSHDVPDYYLKYGLEKTGSANIVNAIVWDFRAYDTLGEETVLFATVLAIFLLVHQKTEFKTTRIRKFVQKLRK